MRLFYFFLCFLIVENVSSQGSISIICPSDVTVHWFDLDEDYDTYGEPEVISQQNYNVTKAINTFNVPCQQRYTIIKYVGQTTNGSTAECEQRVTVTLPTLDDINFPGDIDLTDVELEDATPEVAGYPEPWNQFQGNSTILANYTDIIIPPATQEQTYKIVRTWTALDWCSSNTKEHIQLIKLFGVQVNLTSLTVESCASRQVQVDEVIISTDQAGYQISTETCDLQNNDLLSYFNCVANANSIDDNQSFILEFEGPEDHLNGVSTLDMVIIQKHILGLSAINNPCYLVAADVSSDGKITAFDLLNMRKLILGQISNFSKPAWLFLNEEYFNTNLPDSERDLIFKKQEFPLSELNIVAVKLGDVNGSSN